MKYAKAWRAKNRDKIKINSAEYYSQNKDKVLEQMRCHRIQVKSEVIRAYSETSSCDICRTPFVEFLAIDHVDGGGRQHLRSLGHQGGYRFYVWLKKNDYPSGYRVLCHNCNLKHGKKEQPKKGFRPLSEYSEKTASLVLWLIAHPENHARYNENKRLHRQEQRRLVISHYGGVCRCCGLDDLEILSIDHIDGGGSSQRKLIGDSSYQMYKWIISNGFPDNFQVLCMNCNIAKHQGTCPHQSRTQDHI